MDKSDFLNLYNHGFIRVALCTPKLAVADPQFNAQITIEMAHEAAANDAVFTIFPELGLSAYSSEDLFHQEALLKGVLEALTKIISETKNLEMIFVVGAPIVADSGLFNCAVVINRGIIEGIALKSYLPNYREFYEGRQFRPAEEAISKFISICGQDNIPFGSDLIFEVKNVKNFSFFIEICEDVWVPVPPSSYAAMAGATVIGNLSASNVTVGKADYRHNLVSNQSARLLAAYLYTASGWGESTTDLAWDGHAIIYENGSLLSESERFSRDSQIIYGEIDLDRLAQERMRMTSFGQNAKHHKENLSIFRRVPLNIITPKKKLCLTRDIPRFPYVPSEAKERDRRCYEIYNIQVNSLLKRLISANISNIIIGVSGGLDSTHALIVAARTMDMLQLDRSHVKAYTMPGFATSDKTYSNALKLMKFLGVESNELDIRESCRQMFRDIGHPFSKGEPIYDITFENVQAGERTSHLFRLANLREGIVLGTGDLSELALGWCSYGVGDHMSHYNPNASVPKTLIQYLIRWVVDSGQFDEKISNVLIDILNTEISPELIPGKTNGTPHQSSESTVGPYELQDFNNFYTTRYGYLPTKIAFMEYCAWRDRNIGPWPDVPEEKREEYGIDDIKKWLTVYLYRFFKTSQFKRSCLPNSPKVGSGGSLSPRGDYRAPSDAEAKIWLKYAEEIPTKDELK